MLYNGEGGRFPLFFIGGKMLEYVFCFFVGMFFMYCLSILMALGHSVNVLRRTQISVAAMFLVSEQGINEVLQLKYLVMKEARRSEQNINAQIHIDQVSLQSVRKSIMRNYLATFPGISTMHIAMYESIQSVSPGYNLHNA